jgi:hypothetical protein
MEAESQTQPFQRAAVDYRLNKAVPGLETGRALVVLYPGTPKKDIVQGHVLQGL